MVCDADEGQIVIRVCDTDHFAPFLMPRNFAQVHMNESPEQKAQKKGRRKMTVGDNLGFMGHSQLSNDTAISSPIARRSP